MRRRFAPALLVTCAVLLAACQSEPMSPTAEAGRRSGSPPAAPLEPPTAEVVALAASMSDEGRRAFYGARAKVLDKAEFGLVCPDPEGGQVLGCYTNGRIYILRVSRPELTGVMEVTAAHEMLHAVYDELPPKERRRLDGWVEDFYGRVSDTDVRELVAEYERVEPGNRLDELHSILPTQLPSLDPLLEKHYSRYFTDRQRVAEAYLGYRGILKELERRIDLLHTEIDAVKAQLDVLDKRVESENAELEQLDRRLASLRAGGSVRDYNQLIPQQNAQVRSVQALVQRYNQLVAVHNAKIDEVNDLALEQNQLVDSLEGKAPVSP